MAALRPFRGLRYTTSAGDLGALLSPPSSGMTLAGRDTYVARNPHNSVMVAQPEGHGDDRSKFIRYARAAARLSEWRRGGMIVAEAQPALYRLTQHYGTNAAGDPIERIALLAVVNATDEVRQVEASDSRMREDRLRLLEATRTTFEPAVGFYQDPASEALSVVSASPASSEIAFENAGVAGVLETITDPEAIDAIVGAFRSRPVYVADGSEGLEAAREFRSSLGTREGSVPEDGVLLSLSSLDAHSSTRLPVHPILRRMPGGLDRPGLIARLATRFAIEEHHNRNLSVYLDRANAEGRTAFGLATEGGLGYLLTPLTEIDGPAASWLQKEILVGLLGVSERDPFLYLSDPVQAARTADEGAAAAFILPAPGKDDVLLAARKHEPLPYQSALTYPPVPTGLVYWSMGDDV